MHSLAGVLDRRSRSSLAGIFPSRPVGAFRPGS
jgi:hypothetical protein